MSTPASRHTKPDSNKQRPADDKEKHHRPAEESQTNQQQQQEQISSKIESFNLREQTAASQSNERNQIPFSATRDKEAKRLPTFGSIPQRLTHHLPYFSYSGRAKNIELSHRDRTSGAGRFNQLNRSDGSTATSLTSGGETATSSSGVDEQRDGGVIGSSRRSSGSRGSSGSSDRLENSFQSSGRTELRRSKSASKIPTLTQRISKFALNKIYSPQQQQSRPKSSVEQDGEKDQLINEDKQSSAGRQRRGAGFSNISNLFPDQLTSANRKQRQQSASLLDLSKSEQIQQQQRGRQTPDKKLLSSLSRDSDWLESNKARLEQRKQQQQLEIEKILQQRRDWSVQSLANLNTYKQQLATMRRQQQQQLAVGGHQQKGPQQKQHYVSATRARPASAAGNYLSSASHHQRSPSAGSMYNRGVGGGSGGGGRHPLGSAGVSPYGHQPPLIDQDQMAFSHQLQFEPDLVGPPRKPARQAVDHQFHSSSQPDLLYEDELFQQQQYTPNYYDSPSYRKPQNAFSPVSPTIGGGDRQPRLRSAMGGGHSNANLSAAYYNSPSRFSVYHSPAIDGGGGTIRSSLAPTSEQLRRILGYRPPHSKPVHLHPQWAYSRPFIHLQPPGSSASPNMDGDGEMMDETGADSLDGPRFYPFNRLQDAQAIRAIDFHPSGEVYAVGSNSRALRICAYPAEHELRHFNPILGGGGGGDSQRDAQQATDSQGAPMTTAATSIKPPRVLFKFLQLHRGSIYCVGFNASGQLLATGSNDQTVHLVRYNSVTHNPDGDEFRLTMHNGTIRDLCFIDDFTSGSSLLLSAGGGDNKIYVTDCDTVTPFQSMAGHTQMVMALDHSSGAQFVSGSYDKTIRFWDLRSRTCTSIISAPAGGGAGTAATLGGPGAPVCSLRVDPSGRLLASGHTDSTCMLYDIRGGKIIQSFRAHDDEIRAISFSAKSYYMLTGGYDGRLVVSDLQGDLTRPLPSVCVAESPDKIVQAKWHPTDFTFVATSADKTATLWAPPGDFLGV